MINEKLIVGSKRDIIWRFDPLLYRKGHHPSRVQQLAAIKRILMLTYQTSLLDKDYCA